MPDQPMIERMARAMCEAAGNLPDEYAAFFGGKTARHWQMMKPVARAALIAMREPTKAMLKAKAPDDDGNEVGIDGYLDDLSADNIWRAMIDTALAEDGVAMR